MFQVTAYNLFWFSGTILHSGISKTGDWTFAVKEMVSEPYRKILLITAGLLFYIIIIRVLNVLLDNQNIRQQNEPLTRKNLLYSFMFASVAAFVAGLFFQSDKLHAALEGLLEMAASLPILFLKYGNNAIDESYKFRPNYYWGLTVLIFYVAFCLTLGKGIA